MFCIIHTFYRVQFHCALFVYTIWGKSVLRPMQPILWVSCFSLFSACQAQYAFCSIVLVLLVGLSLLRYIFKHWLTDFFVWKYVNQLQLSDENWTYKVVWNPAACGALSPHPMSSWYGYAETSYHIPFKFQ